MNKANNKANKEMVLYRPLKISKDVNTCIDRFRIPYNAVYGRIRPNVYIMVTNFKQFKEVKPSYDIFVLYLNKGWGGFQPSKLTKNNFAYKHVVEFISRYDLYDVKCKAVDVRIGAPQKKEAPKPQTRIYKQASVDGKYFNISWEENHTDVIYDKSGRVYNGFPVHYETNKQLPPAAFTPFEGVTDTETAKRRDGMKVNQVKIRPEKTSSRKVTIVNHDGVHTYVERTEKVNIALW